MQDPLFQLTQDQPVDLSTFFNPTSPVGNAINNGEESFEGAPLEESFLSPEQAREMDQISEERKEDVPTKNSLEKRIQEVEDHYNNNPIPIYGSIQKRLVTFAKVLYNKKLSREASLILGLIDCE